MSKILDRLFVFLVGLGIGLVALTPTSAATRPNEKGVVQVVLDGDTIILKDHRRVRFAKINAQEKGQCYGPEATAYVKSRLPKGTQVTLKYDTETFDFFGRTLAYVFIGNENLNITELKLGYARIYEKNPGDRYVLQGKRAEENARKKKLGLWDC